MNTSTTTVPNKDVKSNKSKKQILIILFSLLVFICLSTFVITILGTKSNQEVKTTATNDYAEKAYKRTKFVDGLNAFALENRNATSYYIHGIKTIDLYITNEDMTELDCKKFTRSVYADSARLLGFERVVCNDKKANTYTMELNKSD